MVKNHKLAQAILDCAWGSFLTMIAYKCDTLIKIDRWIASSQLCSVCGEKNEEVKKLAVRAWKCPHCGVSHDRDRNASLNILKAGLQQ